MILYVFIWIFFFFLSFIATRETSFVHAISAAGVMYTLTRNCSLGDLENCGCDVPNNGKTGEVLLLRLLGAVRSIFHVTGVTGALLESVIYQYSEVWFFVFEDYIDLMLWVQVVEAGCGVVAVITWISERGSPNCTWMRRRQDRTPEQLSTCTTTLRDGRWLHLLKSKITITKSIHLPVIFNSFLL